MALKYLFCTHVRLVLLPIPPSLSCFSKGSRRLELQLLVHGVNNFINSLIQCLRPYQQWRHSWLPHWCSFDTWSFHESYWHKWGQACLMTNRLPDSSLMVFPAVSVTQPHSWEAGEGKLDSWPTYTEQSMVGIDSSRSGSGGAQSALTGFNPTLSCAGRREKLVGRQLACSGCCTD